MAYEHHYYSAIAMDVITLNDCSFLNEMMCENQ